MFLFPSDEIQTWCIRIIHDHILPDLKIWPFKSQVSAAAAALFNENAQCSTVFCLSDEKDLKLMRWHYSFRTSILKIYHPKESLNI